MKAAPTLATWRESTAYTLVFLMCWSVVLLSTVATVCIVLVLVFIGWLVRTLATLPSLVVDRLRARTKRVRDPVA